MALDDGSHRTCASLTRTGRPCKAIPLKGRDVCLAHADEITREKTRFGGRQPGAGRPPKPKLSDIERQLVEEHLEKVLRPYWRTLGYDVVIAEDTGEGALVELPEGGAKLYGTASRDGRVNMSEHDDLATMMAASEKLRDRVYGRPRQQQRVEVSGVDGDAVRVGHSLDLRQLTDDELGTLHDICASVEARAAANGC
jgi:hypothetical protein